MWSLSNAWIFLHQISWHCYTSFTPGQHADIRKLHTYVWHDDLMNKLIKCLGCCRLQHLDNGYSQTTTGLGTLPCPDCMWYCFEFCWAWEVDSLGNMACLHRARMCTALHSIRPNLVLVSQNEQLCPILGLSRPTSIQYICPYLWYFSYGVTLHIWNCSNAKLEILQLTIIVMLYYCYENKRASVFFTVKATKSILLTEGVLH